RINKDGGTSLKRGGIKMVAEDAYKNDKTRSSTNLPTPSWPHGVWEQSHVNILLPYPLVRTPSKLLSCL
ncbi:MAG: hypothetical protein ACKO96_05340, partial [Flammeovirgaceae bacterium]